MLVVLTSHPIQYQAPLWRAISAAADFPMEVWFLTNQGHAARPDAEFGQVIRWDLDLTVGYRHQFLRVRENWDLRRFRGVVLRESLREKMTSCGAQAVWVEGWRLLPFWQAVYAAKKAGAEVWMRGDSNDLKNDGSLARLIKRPLMRHFFRRVDRFLCVGSANRRLYESYGVSTNKLSAAPHFVDNDRFAMEARIHENDRVMQRAGWRIPENAYCVLFCGKFIEKKRPLDLIAAVSTIGNRTTEGRPIHLLFVGSGTLGELLKRSCQVVFDAESNPSSAVNGDMGGGPTASFIGFLNQTEIVKAYLAADLLVLPSDCRETWGLVVNEALACGRPAIVSDQCGCAEDMVAPLDRDFVFRCGDSGALAKSICRAMVAPPSPESIRAISDVHHLRHTVTTVRRLYDATHGR